MRILLVVPVMPRPDGAGAIPVILHSQLLGLSARHQVTVVAGLGDEPGEAEAARQLEDDGIDLHVADRRQPAVGLDRWRRRARLATSWLRKEQPWRTVWYAAPSYQEVLDRLGASRDFDLVAVEDDALAVFRYPPGVPAVLTEGEVRRPRSIDWRPGRLGNWGRWAMNEIDWRRWHRFQRATWERFERVQVFTDRDAATIAELAPEVAPRVKVNPFGMALPPAADSQREVPNTVLFVGNFSHAPNRDAATWLATEIMPAIRNEVPEARLSIVGSAPPPEVVELDGAGVEIHQDVADVRPHVEAASVVLAPVRIGGGMRLKVLDALARGKPVVTTTRGAEGYGEDPPLVIADEAESIATETVSLLANASARHKLGASARAFAEHRHSPQAWADRLEVIYEEAREQGAVNASG